MVKRVLLVDDEPNITATLSLILNAAGFLVQTANSGAEALEVAQNFGPDALITDYVMPGMNGLELAQRIIQQFPGCRVLVFSGHANVPRPSWPGYRFLAKPVSPQTLLDLLQPETENGNIARPPRVLFIDDVESHRYSVARLLRLAGFDVVERTNGEEALRGAVRRPDIILLDVGLPDIDGFEVCRLLKARRETASIPVIHLTASHLDDDDRNESLDAGAYDFITEPFDPEHLLMRVRSALQVSYLERPESA